MTPFYIEESIYNLLPPEGHHRPKSPRYISRFRPSVKREGQERRTHPCKTMGIPKLQLPTQQEFLRKHSKEPKLPKRARAGHPKKALELHVPRRTDHPVLGIRSQKNFITANTAQAIMAVAKKPTQAMVDMRKGDKFLIENSGLVKKYLKKKDFGITPRYLKKRNQEARRVQEEEEEVYQLEKRSGIGLTRLSVEEKDAVLEGLKSNWEEVNKAYQSLSVVVGSIPRRLYKEKLELQMKQLEHDIKALEKHTVTYVANR